MTYSPLRRPSSGKYVTLRAGPALVALVVGLAAAGCELGADSDHPALNHYQGGSRLDDRGDLVVWLGDECDGITSIRFELDREEVDAYETWTIRSRRATGATIGGFTPGVAPDAFREVDPLRGDWRDAYAVSVLVRTRTSQTASYLLVSDFLAEAEERGPDEWFVQDHGWYTQDAYRAELVGADNADIYPLCAPHD